MNMRSTMVMLAVGMVGIAAWAVFGRVGERSSGPPTGALVMDRDTIDFQRTAVPHEAQPDLRSSVVPPQSADWTRRYHESTDDFALALELADAAVHGDAHAKYRLGALLLRCELYKRILSEYTDGSVPERIEFHLANGKLPEHSRSEFRRNALRCGGLFTGDPFAGYDLPQEARDFRYWTREAILAGDPLAVMNRAFRDATDQRETADAEEQRALRERLLSDVRLVVFSGNGAALYQLGGMLSHPSVVTDPEDGYAWIVAACASGYDCSNANPDVGAGCVARATCEPAQTFLDVLQRDLGAGKYGAIYAKAQDIQYKIKANDWDGLQQYLDIK